MGLLIKVIVIGDELVFELSEGKKISVILVDKGEKLATFKVTNELEPPCYLKQVTVGEILSFDASREQFISVKLTDMGGRSAVLKIAADRSIPIRHVRQQSVSTGA
jgi:hypothetical protein